ncbi:Hsp20/alpha crystallin family protein [Halodesulfovibrio spirochaetisodalis]|uniref:Molecular chaperone Hsp20 n=1 Tax=Halodesulfovibrio spirochaetisodalis TaxID=1560234 RepID=A0A1B7XCD0_9BACT|nr:Hsp20/alpha crystallin family protein [Halodesulfovibrio spirochaetisodalis]OBQ51510.1 molecular chaperone Hsp20 [Halodesulfovibrio spirochaetisodalis]
MQQIPNRIGKRPRVQPHADFVEREDGFYLYLDMPGVEKEKLHLDIENDKLSVQAKSDFGLTSGERVHSMEFGEVEYFARFEVSELVDKQKVSAKFENGVLTIYLPKRKEAPPKRIKIEVL